MLNFAYDCGKEEWETVCRLRHMCLQCWGWQQHSRVLIMLITTRLSLRISPRPIDHLAFSSALRLCVTISKCCVNVANTFRAVKVNSSHTLRQNPTPSAIATPTPGKTTGHLDEAANMNRASHFRENVHSANPFLPHIVLMTNLPGARA